PTTSLGMRLTVVAARRGALMDIGETDSNLLPWEAPYNRSILGEFPSGEIASRLYLESAREIEGEDGNDRMYIIWFSWGNRADDVGRSARDDMWPISQSGPAGLIGTFRSGQQRGVDP
ncbi:hypothetical protein U1Q18_042509, partial [Sarracenia purpurea var. burkii]